MRQKYIVLALFLYNTANGDLHITPYNKLYLMKSTEKGIGNVVLTLLPVEIITQ